MGPLGKLHNISTFIRASPQRWQEFKRLAGKGLPQDNDTRWNSWYTLLAASLDLRPAITEFIDNHFIDLREDCLTYDDWALLRETNSFLQPFFIATKKIEGDRATLDRVQITMDYLIDHLKQAKIKYASNLQMNSSVLTAWFTFDKYYCMADDTPALLRQ